MCHYSFTSYSVAVALLTVVVAFSPDAHPVSQRRLAVIGSGAAGSSAAFWLSKARVRNALNFTVDVYERNSYVGGRSTIVYPYNDTALTAVELGASIFVTGNCNLQRAVQEFGLNLTGFGLGDGVDGVWDGQTIVVEEGGTAGEDAFAARYGLESIQDADAPVQDFIAAVASLYTSTRPVWATIDALARNLNWTSLLVQTGAQFFSTQNVTQLYIREFIEAVARANYNQDVDKMHAVGTMVGLSTAGSSSVVGGNRQIFEGSVRASQASLLLNTEVYAIVRSGVSKEWTILSSVGARTYDAVVLAAPFHLSNIVLPPNIAASIPQQAYRRVHVTLIATSNPSINATYLGAQNLTVLPNSVLISLNATKLGGGPPFNDIAYLATLNGTSKDGANEFVVKLFSDAELSDAFVDMLFEGTVGWRLRHTWEAFPELVPTRSFPPIHLAKGLFYVNALEPVLSTMETETLAARNVVDMLLLEQFSSGICPPGRSPPGNVTGFVYGWDC